MRHLLALASLAFASVSSAALYNVSATLTGAAERPTPNDSTATGTLTGTFDDVSGLLNVNVIVNGLSSNSNNAHIHGFADASGAAGVKFGFGATGLGATTYNQSRSFTVPAADTANYLAGLGYMNVHSVNFGGGEVRGQMTFTPVPEPASMAVLGLGLAAFKRRRKN